MVPYSPPAPESLPPSEPDKHEGPGCLLGDICFGPMLTLGILDVFGIGAQIRGTYWGLAFDYQFFNFTVSNVPIGLKLITIEARAYPFGGSFFLAAGLAWQHASLTGHVHYDGDGQIPEMDADLKGKISVPVLKLGLGFMSRSGLVFGIDLGFGIQLGKNKVEFSTDLPRVAEVEDEENKIRDRADKTVRALPFLMQLNLLRIGFLF
jgi:hypothetical protein